MKKLSLVLAFIICLSTLFAGTVSAFSLTEHYNPFTGERYDQLYGSGVIFILLNHEYSIEWREYTAADFPELDVEKVDTHPPLYPNVEDRIADPLYVNLIYITLRDKSDEATVNAIYSLYERHDVDIDFACPVYSSYIVNGGIDEPEAPMTAGVTEVSGVSVILAGDSTFTDIYLHTEQIPVGSTVYYRVVCRDGYFCYDLRINSETADENSFVMPENLEMHPQVCFYGDSNSNERTDLYDVSFLLKYLTSSYPEISRNVRNRSYGEKYLDFNGDGKVNIVDCARMLQYIAGWNGVGQKAPEYEEGFEIMPLLKGAEISGYFTDDPSFAMNSEGRAKVNKYNSDIITSVGAWREFTGDMLGVNDSFAEIGRDGSLSSSEIDSVDIRDKYDAAFFREYDLIPLIIVSPERSVYVKDVWKKGDEAFPLLFIGDGNDAKDSARSFFFIAVPKGCVKERGLFLTEATLWPEFNEVKAPA